MQWIYNLKIAQKLGLILVLAIFFVALVSGIGYYFNANATKATDSMYRDRLLPIEWLSENITIAYLNKYYLYEMVTINNESLKKAKFDEIKIQAAKFNENLKNYQNRQLLPYENETLEKLKTELAAYRILREEIAQKSLAGNNKAALSQFMAHGDQLSQFSVTLQNLIDFNTKQSDEVAEQNVKDAAFVNFLMISIFVASTGLLLFIGLMISNMISRPITRAVQTLNEGVNQISSASSQLSSSSQMLAEGSSEQASSIEETSATLEESSSMVRQNTENTKQAAILAKQTKEAAENGNKEMNAMMNSMTELKKSSDEIAKIIKVIDEIAFQTNILALNAAVEAARAGEAGMGFAVVAEEVRNLAQRSAQAAKDTASIIESNIHLSEQGVEVSKHVNSSLEEINTQAHKVSELIDEISTASQEQAQGIAQINKAISQMEQVVQANASTAEESSSASSELLNQATGLKDVVRALVSLVEGAGVGIQGGQSYTSYAPIVEQPKQYLPKQAYTTTARPISNKSIGKKTKTVSPEDVIPLNDDMGGF